MAIAWGARTGEIRLIVQKHSGNVYKADTALSGRPEYSSTSHHVDLRLTCNWSISAGRDLYLVDLQPTGQGSIQLHYNIVSVLSFSMFRVYLDLAMAWKASSFDSTVSYLHFSVTGRKKLRIVNACFEQAQYNGRRLNTEA